MPGQLFYTTPISVCLWLLARNKHDRGKRDRKRYTLFIDARKSGTMADRTHVELSENEINRIATTYHSWCGEKGFGKYEDTSGFCKSATLGEISANSYVLTPGIYVGSFLEDNSDQEPFAVEFKRLKKQLISQMSESNELNKKVLNELKRIDLDE